MDGTIIIGTKVDTKEFDAQILQLERKINDMERDLEISISTGEFAEDSKEAEELRVKIEKAKNQLVSLNKQKEKYNSTGYTTEGLKGLGDPIGKAFNKIGRIVLSIFSIRSAYGAMQRASSLLAQYNSQYATDLEFIRYAIVQAIAPILEKVVKLAYTLLGYMNYLAKIWFGKPIFAENLAKNFAKASKSTSEIKKNLQTTPFDEMNVLSDTSTSGADAGISMPSMDFKDVEIPEWLKKFAELTKPIIDFFKEIIEKYGPVAGGIMIVVGALAGFYILKTLISLFTNMGKAVTGISADFTGFFNALGKATEIIAILGGLALVIGQVTELIKAFSESGLTLGEVAGLLAIVLGELAIAFTVMAAATKLIDLEGAVGAIAILGGLALVIDQVTSLINTFSKSGLKLSDVATLLATVFLSVVAAMTAMSAIAMLLTSNPLALVGLLALVAAISAILLVMKETLPTILESCSKFINETSPAIIKLLTTIAKCIQVIIIALGTTLVAIINSVGNLFNTVFTGIERIVNTVGTVTVKVLQGIKEVIKQIGDTIQQVAYTIIWFINTLGPSVDNLVSHIISSITKVVNFIVSAIEYLVNTALRGLNNVIGVINNIPGINIPRIQSLYIPRFTPRLAVGGLINNPGRGVPLGGGSAIGGEAGPEGVIPLTDSQAMETLGEAIGRYITINANITNTMNGRIISRQLQQIRNDKEFAYNG